MHKSVMQYRKLGQTELLVSEIGLGGEWLERHTAEECKQVIEQCEAEGIRTQCPIQYWICNKGKA